MQQETHRRIPPLSHGRTNSRLAFWLPVLCLGIFLGPAEYFLVINSLGSHALVPFPWVFSTLSICFVSGVLCALFATLHMESRRAGTILLRSVLSSVSASLLNIGLWLVLLLIAGMYTIYHPAPPMGGPGLHLAPSWGLLVVSLFLFLGLATIHLIVTLVGGVLGGLIRGIIVQI